MSTFIEVPSLTTELIEDNAEETRVIDIAEKHSNDDGAISFSKLQKFSNSKKKQLLEVPEDLKNKNYGEIVRKGKRVYFRIKK